MAMIYVTDIAAKKLKESAKRQKRTPGATLELLLESAEQQNKASDQAKIKESFPTKAYSTSNGMNNPSPQQIAAHDKSVAEQVHRDPLFEPQFSKSIIKDNT